MRKLLILFLRFYFTYFPIRKGKIVLLNICTKIGLFRNMTISGPVCNVALAELDLEDWVQKLVYLFGRYEYEKSETAAWIKLIKSNIDIIDIGSNFGYYSLIAAGSNSNVRIHAFEPSTQTYAKLVRNIKLNSFQNITTYNIGVSNIDGSFKLYLADKQNTGMTSLAEPDFFSGKSIDIKVVKLDGFLMTNYDNKLSLVKIDVEGNELNVLLGMKNLITSNKPVIFIEIINEYLNKFGHSAENVFEFFKSSNYRVFNYNQQNEIQELIESRDVGLAICIHKNNCQSVLNILNS